MLRKGVYPYECMYMDDWKKFNEISLPEKEEFYSNLNLEHIADAIFENFREMCLKIYHLVPVKFLSAPGLGWQEVLKKTKEKLELLTDIDTLLTVEKGIRGGIRHAIHRYAKVNNKYMKEYDKNKELSYLKYCDVNNLHGWAMSQKILVNIFEWIEDTSQFNKDFIKSYNEESNKAYFLEVGVQYPVKLHELHNLPFLLEKMKIEKVEKLITNFHDKTEYVVYIRNL